MSTFKEVVSSRNYVILDTETTGLDRGAEIVQIAIIDGRDGTVLLNTLVKPKYPIPVQASRIHGIVAETVANAPTWDVVMPQVRSILAGRNVVIYNAVYDRKMMHSSDEIVGLGHIEWKQIANFYCAMEAYAEYHGEWNDYRGSYRWQKLTDACWQMKLDVKDAHSALGDCLMTRGVIEAMLADPEWSKPDKLTKEDQAVLDVLAKFLALKRELESLGCVADIVVTLDGTDQVVI